MHLVPELRSRPAVLLAVAVLAAISLTAITELAYQRSIGSLASLGSRGAARTAIMTVLRRLPDAESAQRGYLITGRAEYLQPGDEAPEDIRLALERLEQHYAAEPVQLALTAELKARALEKLSELSATLRLYEVGENDSWRELVLTNIGHEQMDAVRSIAERLLAAENANVRIERAYVLETLASNRVGVYLLTALSLLSLVFYLRKTVALATAQRRHADDLQAERDELDVQVQHRTAELTELASHLQTVREDERSRLARELHDELGALLTAAKLDVARLKRGIGPLTPDLDERIKHLNSTIDQGIALKRNIIEDLRPSSLSNLGLMAALEIQGREFGTRSGLRVQMELAPVSLPAPSQITVYRVVQESLTNIAKYAGATEVRLSLQPEGNRVSVAISDDGCGFDPAVRGRSSHGLTGMRYRVEADGGELRVVSSPGHGTRVQAWLPAAVT